MMIYAAFWIAVVLLCITLVLGPKVESTSYKQLRLRNAQLCNKVADADKRLADAEKLQMATMLDLKHEMANRVAEANRREHAVSCRSRALEEVTKLRQEIRANKLVIDGYDYMQSQHREFRERLREMLNE